MKILKVLLIILVPALGIVSCKKADLKPGSCATSTDDKVKNNTADDNSSSSDMSGSGDMGARRIIISKDGEQVYIEDKHDPEEIIGSGDDDRDGGDKKKKTR